MVLDGASVVMFTDGTTCAFIVKGFEAPFPALASNVGEVEPMATL